MPLHKKTNPALVSLVTDLKKKSWENEAPIWRDIANRLEKPTKNRIEVNVSRIERYLREGEVALVPGKLLAAGAISRKVTVAAYGFSDSARTKIEAAGGQCLTIRELLERSPKGEKVRIIG